MRSVSRGAPVGETNLPQGPQVGSRNSFPGTARHERDLRLESGGGERAARRWRAPPAAVPEVALDEIRFEPSRLQRLLNTSWPLFRAFRVDVRIFWTVTIWPILFVIEFAQFLPFPSAVAWAIAWTIALYVVTWTHEMGHVAMGRRCGIDTSLITLSGIGGLSHLQERSGSPRDDILISLAGPATHLIWMAVLYPLVWSLRGTYGGHVWFWMLDGFAALQIWFMVFNLLPVFPLDGGRTLHGILTFRMHESRASHYVSIVGFVGNGLFVVVGVLSLFGVDPLGFHDWGFLLAWIGLEGIQACRRLRLEAKFGDGFYADPDPFQKTLLASREAMREIEKEEEKQRETERAVREERRILKATVDRLLDRINEAGGIDGLTRRERKELEQASRKLKKGG